jgi:hypothetical protein
MDTRGRLDSAQLHRVTVEHGVMVVSSEIYSTHVAGTPSLTWAQTPGFSYRLEHATWGSLQVDLFAGSFLHTVGVNPPPFKARDTFVPDLATSRIVCSGRAIYCARCRLTWAVLRRRNHRLLSRGFVGPDDEHNGTSRPHHEDTQPENDSYPLHRFTVCATPAPSPALGTSLAPPALSCFRRLLEPASSIPSNKQHSNTSSGSIPALNSLEDCA